jgi:hypothetical protein
MNDYVANIIISIVWRRRLLDILQQQHRLDQSNDSSNQAILKDEEIREKGQDRMPDLQACETSGSMGLSQLPIYPG